MNFQVSMVVVVQLMVIFRFLCYVVTSCSNTSENVTTRNHYNKLWNAKIIFSCVIRCNEYSKNPVSIRKMHKVYACTLFLKRNHKEQYKITISQPVTYTLSLVLCKVYAIVSRSVWQVRVAPIC